MNTRIKESHTMEKRFRDARDTFFGRTVDDILFHDFFNSFDANIREEQDAYRLEIAVPGMTRNDIIVRVDGAVMSISAQRQKENNSRNAMEFSGKHLQRSFILPPQADTNNIKAKCRNGLLRIKVGKIKSKGIHRVIKIDAEQTGAVIPDKLTSWWNRIMDKVSQIFHPNVD